MRESEDIEKVKRDDMSKVIIEKADYRYEIIGPMIFEILDELGGDTMIWGGRRVLIKPNLLTVASPRDAIVTHYQVVKAVVEYVLDKGAIPRVSDSPALGSFRKVLKESGILGALEGLKVECREFRESLPVDIGEPFGVIDLARDALEADLIINLPKLKTHGQMLLTLGVKNMFGCVVGLRKPQWHMKAGVNRQMFARLVVQIYRRIRPSLTILDGIMALEGEGPGKRGSPRRLGLIMGSRDAVALDTAVCHMLGLEPDSIPILRAARELGLPEKPPEVEGEMDMISDFQLPSQSTPLVFGPPVMQGFLRRHLLPRPLCDRDLCQWCGKCGEFCPIGAIGQEGKRLAFDYERCIRCYCCIEVCPGGALHAVEPLAGRVLSRLIKGRNISRR